MMTYKTILSVTGLFAVMYVYLVYLTNSTTENRLLFEDDHKSVTTVVEEQYIVFIPKPSEGLNNYLISVEKMCGISSLLNRTILLSKYPYNAHARYNRIETLNDFIKSIDHPSYNQSNFYTFTELFSLRNGTLFHYLNSDHLRNKSLVHQCDATNKQLNITSCLLTAGKSKYLFIKSPFDIPDKALQVLDPKQGIRRRCISIHPNVFQLVHSILGEYQIHSQFKSIHLRLGDFKQYCRNKLENCYFTPERILPVLSTKVGPSDHVIIITNEVSNRYLQQFVNQRKNWYISSDILKRSKALPDRMKKDQTALVVLDMTIGSIAKHFYGNRASTMTGMILYERSMGVHNKEHSFIQDIMRKK
jgi:hypothetical protein